MRPVSETSSVSVAAYGCVSEPADTPVLSRDEAEAYLIRRTFAAFGHVSAEYVVAVVCGRVVGYVASAFVATPPVGASAVVLEAAIKYAAGRSLVVGLLVAGF